MSQNKYIGTADAARLTGLKIREIYDLIHEGKLQAHKAPKSGWRISSESLAKLEIEMKKSLPVIEKHLIKDGFSFVADREHYTKVFKKMTEVKKSLKIATADLKNFNVYFEDEDTNEPLRLCDFFLSLVERGVRIEVVSMKPLGFFNYTKENCPQLLKNPLFELRLCENNHMKVFIFDDEYAYIGSANMTGAAIGKRANGKRNHEAGMLVWGPNIIQAPLQHFETVWNDPYNLKSSWKRFTTKAKELEKELRMKYGI